MLLAKVSMKKFRKLWDFQKVGLLNLLVSTFLRVGLSFLKNTHMPLGKSVLMTLGLIATASATDAAIQDNVYGSDMTTLILSLKINERYHGNT